MDDDKIIMLMDDGEEVEFTIIDSTVFGGSTYILVTDAPDDEDGECFVLKDVSDPEDDIATYESIYDDAEEEALFSIFRELLEGDIEIE